MLDKIREALQELSKSERKVAELTLAQPNLIAYAPIAQIAKLAGVSQPTVIRFCRSINCKGLHDFKLRLTRHLVSGISYIHNNLAFNDSTHDLAGKLFDNTISSLSRTRNDLDHESLQQAIHLLTHAHKIEFYGLGNSGIVAQDAHYKFFRLGIQSIAYSDPHLQTIAASLLSHHDVLVAISNSGRSIDLLHAVHAAHEVGAKIIALSRSHSPLAKLADITLSVSIPETPELYAPMTTRIAQLMLVDLLAIGVTLHRGPNVLEQLEGAKHRLKRYHMNSEQFR